MGEIGGVCLWLSSDDEGVGTGSKMSDTGDLGETDISL